MNFRIYLLDATSRIRAAESFSAHDDSEAAGIALATYDACSDVFEGYELWCGSTCIARRARKGIDRPRLNAWSMAMMRQDDVLDLEDRLHRSFACIRESTRLLTVSSQLRELWRYEGSAKH